MKYLQLAIGVLVILSIGTGATGFASAPNASNMLHELAPKMPIWVQVNSSGFGTPLAAEVTALVDFNGFLYAGIRDATNNARVYRSQGGSPWTAASEPGFGVPHDNRAPAILDLAVFKGYLYASTGLGDGPAQIWRAVNGVTWAPVVIDGFSDPDLMDITVLAEYGGYLYAGATHLLTGARIYRSLSGDSNSWTQVAPATPGTEVASVTGFAVFGGALYSAVESTGPAQIWKSTGGAWTPVMSNGFGSSQTTAAGGLAVLGGYLYAGAGNSASGAQLWRTNNGTSWTQVSTSGFGDPNNRAVETVFVFQNQLYIGLQNVLTGIELWRWTDSLTWEQINPDGFGDRNNINTNRSNAVTQFLGHLYLGTVNSVDGGEVWRMQQPAAYLPLVRRAP